MISDYNDQNAPLSSHQAKRESIEQYRQEENEELGAFQIEGRPKKPDQPFFTCSSSSSQSHQSNRLQEDSIEGGEEGSQSSSYFESMSSSNDGAGMNSIALLDDEEEELKKIYSGTSSQQNLAFLFAEDRLSLDNQKMQLNSEALHRQQFGGVVIYDSCARIIGNQALQAYYESNPPAKVDFSILFNDKEELQRCDQLFHREPRERDFANDFDKFVYKHLPKFQPERQFVTQNSYTINVPQQENILIFDSRFENGNLRRAIKVNNVEYNLLLENDVNTKGHTQWFYFKVIHKYPKRQKVQFNILNLAKPQSLFPLGMKPCIYSRNQYAQNGTKWFRGGEDVKYFQNDIPRKNQGANIQGVHFNHNAFLYSNNGAGEGLEYYFTLSFIYEFEEEEDEVWFAHAIPYTFTDLQQNLRGLLDKEENNNRLKANVLCKTLAGTYCPLITITNDIKTYMDYYDQLELNACLPSVVKKQFHRKYQKCKKLYKQSMESKGKVRKLLKAAFMEEIKSFFSQYQDDFLKIDERRYENYHNKFKSYVEDHYQKKAIVITSRVHPGEPQASFMLQGIIEFLLSDEAKDLRDNFVFKIVPMLNIDGVIYGNYRCSLLGVDLNRKWMQPNIFLHPTIFYSKQLIRQIHNERRVLIFCDLHGHSRKQNAFFYACTYKNFEHEGRIKNAQLRIIPLLCCHKNNLFKFSDCRFRIEKSKESTARVVIFRDFNIMNSFTLECSFFGSVETSNSLLEQEDEVSPERKKMRQFGIQDFMSVGAELGKVMNNFLPKEQSKLNVLSGKILEIFYDEFIKFIPPYVLRREEEKLKQLNQEGNQGQNQNEYAQQTRIPMIKQVQTSPKQQSIPPLPLNLRNSSVKKQRKSLFTGTSGVIQNQLAGMNSLAQDQVQTSQQNKKAKVSDTNTANQQANKKNFRQKRRATIAKKDIIHNIADDDLNLRNKAAQIRQSESISPFKIQRPTQEHKPYEKQLSQKTDTFSQLINIPPHQEELLDLEQFIKGVKESGLTKRRDSVDEDEDGGVNTDSSDSEASVKNIYVTHTQKKNQQVQQEEPKANDQTVNKIGKKKGGKKGGVGGNNMRGQTFEDSKGDQIKLYKYFDVSKKNKKGMIDKTSEQITSIEIGRQEGIAGGAGVLSQNSSLDHHTIQKKFKHNSKKDAQSPIKQNEFELISHLRQSSSNDDLEGEEIESTIKKRLNETYLSRNKGATLKSQEEEKNIGTALGEQHNQSINNVYFQSYEDLTNSILLERQKIIPLYENAAYHQNRLNNNMTVGYHGQSFIIRNEMNSANSSFIQPSLLQGGTTVGPSQTFKVPNLQQAYEPYEDLKSLSNSLNKGANLGRQNAQSLQQSERHGMINSQKPLEVNHAPTTIPQIKSGHQTTKDEGAYSRHSMPAGVLNQRRHVQSKQVKPEEIYSNRRQQYSNVNSSQPHPNSQVSSLKRMSFRELLESSRQTRVTVSSKGKSPGLGMNSNHLYKHSISDLNRQPEGQNYLLQVLKSTYLRFQQNSNGNYFNRQSSADKPPEDSIRTSGVGQGGLDSEYVSQSPTRRFAEEKETSSYLNVKGYSKDPNSNSTLSSIQIESASRQNRQATTKMAKNDNQRLITNIQRSKGSSQTSSKQASIQGYKDRVALQTSNSMMGSVLIPQPVLKANQQRTPTHIPTNAINQPVNADKRQNAGSHVSNHQQKKIEMTQSQLRSNKSVKYAHYLKPRESANGINYESSSNRGADLSLISADRHILSQNQKTQFSTKNPPLPPNTGKKRTTKINQTINGLI